MQHQEEPVIMRDCGCQELQTRFLVFRKAAFTNKRRPPTECRYNKLGRIPRTEQPRRQIWHLYGRRMTTRCWRRWWRGWPCSWRRRTRNVRILLCPWLALLLVWDTLLRRRVSGLWKCHSPCQLVGLESVLHALLCWSLLRRLRRRRLVLHRRRSR